jgi:hypothetical protein
MGVLEDILKAQTEERTRQRAAERRSEVATVIRQALSGFERHDQMLILGAVANLLESGPSDGSPAVGQVGNTPAPDTAAGLAATGAFAFAGPDSTIAARIESFLHGASAGAVPLDIATAVYADPGAIHRARSALEYLVRKGRARFSDGRWFALAATDKSAPQDAADGHALAGASGLVRRVLSDATAPMSIRDIGAKVRTLNGDIPKSHIYSAVGKMTKSGQILVGGRDDDRRYTLDKSYRPRFGKGSEREAE